MYLELESLQDFLFVLCHDAVPGVGFRVSDFGFRVSGFGFRVSGFGFRVEGFGSWVSCFGFRISGFGFRGSGVAWSRNSEHACCSVSNSALLLLARLSAAKNHAWIGLTVAG